MKKLLLFFAHRGDEETVVGSTIAVYRKIGWKVKFFSPGADYAVGKLRELTPGTLEDPIYRAMERELPNVVVTFDRAGINNDPDHVKVCYATTYAFQKYASWLEGLQKKFRIRAIYDEQWLKRLETMITASVDPKLYYVCVPESYISRAVGKGELPRESFGLPWRGTPDRQITTVIGAEYFILRMEGTKEHFMGKKDSVRDRL